jgi:hypothetical protein
VAKKIDVQYDHRKIPILGLVPESASSAPASPVAGQLWLDTSLTPSRLKVYENGGWVLASQTGTLLTTDRGATNGVASLVSGLVPIAQIPTGTSSTTVPFGNDARFTDQRVPTDGSVTGGTAGAGVKIAANTVTAANVANGTLTDVQVAATNKDGAVGVASLRTIGTGALQALAGNTRLDQVTAPTAAVNLSSQEITNLGAPLSASSAARLSDVQASAAGIDNKPSVRIVLTANDTLSGLAVRDTVTPVDGDRVLAVAQTTASQNGPWIAHSGAWTRPANETVTAGSFWMVTEGSAPNAASQWKVATPDPIVLGTTALTINQFGAGQAYSGTAGRITVTGGVINIDPTYVGQSTITTLGTVTTGVWTGTAIAVLNGGTGATTAAGARTNLGTVSKYAADLPALSAGVEATVTHSLGSTDPIGITFKETTGGAIVDIGVRVIDANSIGVTSDIAYGSAAVRIALAMV